MLIIWGWRAIKKTLDTGTFFCPQEQADRTYQHRSARKWFTLFWIPIIPLKELGDFVECDSCNSTFYPSVLEGKTVAQMQDVMTIAIRHLVVAMTLADGSIDDAEKEAAVDIVAGFASGGYTSSDLERDLVELAGANLEDQLEELGAILSEQGRENVLTAAVRLAAADGSIDTAEIETVEQIGKALTMSQAHIRGVVVGEQERMGLE